MPSFYFHLIFELCPYPANKVCEYLPHEIHLPAADTDIFKDPLQPGLSKKPNRRRKNGTREVDSPDKPNGESRSAPSQRQNQGDSSSKQSDEHLAPASENGSPPTQLGIEHDRRFDSIAIESIDLVPSSSRMEADRTTSSLSNGIAAGPAGIVTRGRYEPTGLQTTEIGWGVVHLYRDEEETAGLDYDTPSKGLVGTSESVSIAGNKEINADECTTLCVLAVPALLTPFDFLSFMGTKGQEGVSHVRLVRTSRDNRYMVLLKFRSPKKAREWQRDFNGKNYIFSEPETCHVVFVKSIRFQTDVGGGDQFSFPDMANDPFTPSPGRADGEPSADIPTSSAAPPPFGSKSIAPTTTSLIELPTCPVCLERMDDTTGLFTILCQHVFHCACLQKWQGSGCPVCRFTHAGEIGVSKRRCEVDADIEKECSACGSDSNLWICLICGNVGCGRYDAAHAFAHYQQTSHCYTLDVATERVWDYGSDGYVHQIMPNKSDGKMVDLTPVSGGAANSGENAYLDEYIPRDKMNNMAIEYTHMITSQLESQRMYFEELLNRAADKASQASTVAEKAAKSASDATQQLSKLQMAHDNLANEAIPGLEKDKARTERKAEKFEVMARKMEKEWREEKAMNENLRQRVDLMGKEITTLKDANSELTESNRDLTFFITSQAKLQDEGEEVQEGTVTVADAPAPKKGKKNKAKGK
ncbi:MAG: hypothetical protein M1812_004899 [Candelaria pacifica]|nr:MAG: hypothetical protein M1812_004899 [Candelaria pacifica]